MKNGPLTTGEIAEHCHVTYRTVLKWVEAGKLKAYKTPGSHTRVRVEDFIGFLKEYNMPIPDEFVAYSNKKKILIVDDDKNMSNSIRRLLRKENSYEIDVAYDGFDAGRRFIAFEPNLVILDIRMPGMDGYEVARKIKEYSEKRAVKIIAISAFFEADGKERIKSMGADLCMDKPFSPEALIEQIKNLVG